MPARLPLLLRLMASLVAAVMIYLAAMDLERADRIASVVGAVIACAAFAVSFIRPPTEQPPAPAGPPQSTAGHPCITAISDTPTAGRDAHVTVSPDRTTTLAIFGLAIFALAAVAIIAAATIALGLPRSEAAGLVVPKALEQSPSEATGHPPSGAASRPTAETGKFTPEPTGKVTREPPGKTTPEPADEATTPGPTKTRATTPTPKSGELTVPADRWVDFDQSPPTVIPAHPSNPITDTVDLRVGPDNLYPENDAENWFKQSPSCAAERSTQGLRGELILKQPLAAKHGAPLKVCLRTSAGTFYTLEISTTHADGGGNPYHFAMTREAAR